MDRSGRRRYRRYDVEGVDGAFVMCIDVKVLNLSAVGMAIETENALVVGRDYCFRIDYEDREIKVDGRVIWCVLGKRGRNGGEAAPVFRAGVQFEDVLSGTTLELQRVIESSAAVDPAAQIFGRFVAEVSGMVESRPQAQFEVKKISMSGMLVDADFRPRKDEVIPMELSLGGHSLTLHGRVAHIDPYPLKGNARYRLGIEYTLLSDTARHHLEAYIGALISLDDEGLTA